MGLFSPTRAFSGGFLADISEMNFPVELQDICQKPPENARVGENKPHWKTVKCDSLLVVSNN